jgi:hypothetical protein
MLVGIDYFKDIMAQAVPDALYGVHSVLFKLVVGNAEWRVKARHKWSGHSMYNPTAGIERAARQDGNFDVGIGAHTHASGLSRQFNNGGKTGYAVLCGSHKEEDDFSDYLGCAIPNESTTVPLVFTSRQSIIAFQTVQDASEYMWNENERRKTKKRPRISERQATIRSPGTEKSGSLIE